MNTIWRKAIRDFWHERARTVLVVLAIALGISAFAAVMSSYAILTRELDRGYLATNPASAVMRLDSIDDDTVKAILENPEVSDAEPRRTIRGQMKAGPVQWRNLMLFVVHDYGNIRVSKLVPEEGAWPPATGEILIERDAFQVAKANIGDVVRVKTANGVEQPLVITGSVHDVGQAQARMENIVYGYINLATLVQLGEEPKLDQLDILVAQKRFDENHIRRVVADVEATINSRGHRVRGIDIPAPGKHPHSDLTGILLLSMSSFGLFVLVLSGILVINLLTAVMASQVRQIGVMKAIGGTRWQIARIYFGQALFLGIAALIVSVPLGILGSRALCRYMALFLNFDINSFAVPAWVYLLVAVVGLAAPLVAAAYPIWSGTKAPVRVALSDFGLSQTTFGASRFDRALARIGGTFRLIVFAIRNSFRRRARLVLTILTLTAGGLFFLTALNVRASMVNTLDRMFAARNYDLSVSLANPYELTKIDEAIRSTPGIRHVEGWFMTEASIVSDNSANAGQDPNANASGLHGGGSHDKSFTVVALPPETELLKLDIIQGRNLVPGDTDAIVINNSLARTEPTMRVGQTVTLRTGPAETTWRVVGLAREAFSPAVAYIPRSFIEQRHPGMANNLRLSLDKSDPDSLAIVKSNLDRNLEQQGVRARGSLSTSESRFAFDEHMLMIYVFLIVMSTIIGGVGGLGLMTTMSLNVLERRREMGVMRALGATPRIVWLMIVAEGIVIGLLSWTMAALLAWPVSKVVGDFIVKMLFRGGLDFTFEPLGLLIWIVVSISLSAAASFLPAWKASRVTVREALAYE
ncbi:MAG TPA: FtsX-like permease family protein [Pyrinomonadaceae bacterium]|nr:FtsX-like permease family protein [Pyrinomonadaceae bacterium]